MTDSSVRKETSASRVEVWEKLYKDKMESKDWDKIQQEKAEMELRNCTFAPSINKKR